MATYTVKKGDCLWSIASRYLGSGTRWTQLADLNGIPRNNPIIYVGQKINLDVGGTPAPSKPKPQVQSRATIEYFSLQAGTDRTLFATWSWDRANTESYQVWWEYDTGQGIWFVGNNSTVEHNIKQSTYSAPDNAVGVQFWVKPLSEKKTVNNSETSYWTASWSTAKQYYFSQNPPVVPQDVTIEIEKYKLTATAKYKSDTSEAHGIQFQIVKNNSTVFNTGSASIRTGVASYSCNVDAGGEYKVRCRSYRGKLYSDWTDYSSGVTTIPSAPGKITSIKATSDTSIYLAWEKSTTAKTYDIEYTTEKDSYFDGSDKTTTISNVEFNHYEKTGLESGQEYFFRVRAVNDKGASSWTDIRSIIIGKKPAAPTTWSSTTTVITGEPLNLYWVHNSEDGSSQTYAELELYIDGRKETYTIENNRDEDEKDKTSVYSIDTSKYNEGVKLQWRVRTAGITKQYGDWSIQRTVDVYAPPSLTFSITDANGILVETLTSFPFYAKALAGPKTQVPTGYYLVITANKAYETTDGTGNIININKGEQIFSEYYDTSDPLLVMLSANNVDLENNIDYTITCTVSMNSGLTVSQSANFTVAWTDDKYEPNAEISINKETLMAYIRPFCDYYPYVYYKVNNIDGVYEATNEMIAPIEGTSIDGVLTDTGEVVYSGTDQSETVYFCVRVSDVGVPVADVTLSVYRREFDGSFTELATGINNSSGTFITDPHPSLDYARYRIVATTISTGAVSYYDMPGYPIEEKAVIIQWNEEWSNFDVYNEDALQEQPWSGSMLKLPYNIDVSDSYDSDVSLVNYIGRKRPVSYYGTQLGETSNWKIDIDRTDIETLYALRRLAIWMGDVYVREPSGSGYWANISVSFSQTHCEVTIPVTLDITRVEGGV